MATISSETIKKVWKYINSLEVDQLDGTVEIIYEEHCPKMNISEMDLANILKEFELHGFITREGYFEGATITFLRS